MRLPAASSIPTLNSEEPNKVGTKQVQKRKIIVTKVKFRYVKNQSATSLEHGKWAIRVVAHPRCRLSIRSPSYYTRVKLSMQIRCVSLLL